MTAGGKPSTWLPPGGCRADTWTKKEKSQGNDEKYEKNKAKEDDRALKESKRERKRKRKQKQRKTKATTKQEQTTEKTHKILKNQDRQYNRTQDHKKKY